MVRPFSPRARKEPLSGGGEGDASLSSVSESGEVMREEIPLLG